MNYSYIHFFNIQYWYCVVISWFGNHCENTGTISVNTEVAQAGNPGAVTAPGFWDWLLGIHGFIWTLFSIIAYMASFALFILIIACLAGLFLIRLRDQELYGNLPRAVEKPHPLRSRWQGLLESTMSATPAKWKEGIQGADDILGELLATLGYLGANTGERIRQVPDGAFANLPSAWEAHRIKNFVFAPSSHFILTQREAFRTMKLYEQVFREFDFI
jgi:hypothetical protein